MSMSRLLQLSRWAVPRPRLMSTSIPTILDASERIEEETFRWYTPTRFCSVKLGDVFQSRYEVLSKMGYGSCSTAWLCRDLRKLKYVAVKVCISNYPSVERERAAYEHISKVISSQPTGTDVVRTSIDEFELSGAEGPHHCFVFEPLTLDLIHTRARGGRVKSFRHEVQGF